MRLAVVAQDYFFLAEQCLKGKVHSLPKDHLQQFEIALDNLKSSGTFLLDKALNLGNLNHQPTMIFSPPEKQDPPVLGTAGSNGCISATSVYKDSEPEGMDREIYDHAAQVVVKRRIKVQSVKPEPDGVTPRVIPTLSQAAETYIAAKKLTWSRSSIKDIQGVIPLSSKASRNQLAS